jgi:putative transposase
MARERLRKAVSDLTLEKLILRGEAHRPNASVTF